VFVNFYADWCRFSNLLAPIFDEAADKVAQAYPDKTKAILGRVDSDKHCMFCLLKVKIVGFV
jgi:endoplasmic reticulum resident protein 44